jgi:AraC-like DNA-binding protein
LSQVERPGRDPRRAPRYASRVDRNIIPLELFTNFMHYQEFHPTEQLAKFIKCFWFLESAPAQSASPERILPDGCPEIVFHLGDPFDQYNSEGTTERQPLALLVGQMRRHLLIQPTGRVRVLGVRFWPGGAYPFLTIPQDEIAEKVLALDSIWGTITHELHSKIADSATPTEGVRHVETTLLSRLNGFRRHDDAVLKAIAQILRSGGRQPVESLAEILGISLRKLDRTFNTRVGLPPKTLCRIVRFQQVFKILERGEISRDWAQNTLDCGYYDQAHFVKEFREFTGKAPNSYFAEQNYMSDYFIDTS